MIILANISKQLICFCWIFLNGVFISNIEAKNCYLPEGCSLKDIYNNDMLELEESGYSKSSVIMCDIRNDQFEFEYKNLSQEEAKDKCFKNNEEFQRIVFRWTSNELAIVDKQFNYSNAVHYFSFFNSSIRLDFWSAKGFDLNFAVGVNFYRFSTIQLTDCRIEFYHSKKKMNSCKDIFKTGLSSIKSIFQFQMSNRIVLRKCEFKKNTCPLVFGFTPFIYTLYITDLVDTFYKQNILTFSNETYNIYSYIFTLTLYRVQHINLDLKFLHPVVFYRLILIYVVSGSLNSIDEAIFEKLTDLKTLKFDPFILRKINHKQGIKWIRQLNKDLNLNLSHLNTNFTNIPRIHAEISFTKITNKQNTPISKIFPEEDFCIYVDYPFNQLVILYNNFLFEDLISKVNLDIGRELTCTYLWLVQYYEYYYKYYVHIDGIDSLSAKFILLVWNTTAFKSISKCNFEEKITLCNRSNYQVKDIWDRNDFLILNKKFETVFKISLYLISFLGLVTNLIVIIVIFKKDNTDLFKEYKQYSYLWLNSMFCMMISVIEILSWMTECFYPFEVFCPEIRKLVAIQFFRIIFKECLVTLFRFMCNFTYVAFALNRIGLIGKDHGKVVTFISEVGIKKYIGVTILISLSLSWIKFFKYEVNYIYPDLNFPVSNELDLRFSKKTSFNKAFYIINSISDLVNYFFFVIICIIIDICMVVQLRRTLEEKMKKSESLNPKQKENKKVENEKAIKKVIKMVVLNSTIGILLKLPVTFIPLVNMYAKFFYLNNDNLLFYHPLFSQFYVYLSESGFNFLFQNLFNFLYNLSLSIQLFIYKYFDKKFRAGYDKLTDLIFKKIN